MEKTNQEIFDEIEREITFIADVKDIMAKTQNKQEIGRLTQIAFNKMNEKIEE